MHMSSWPCEFDRISLHRRCLSMAVLVINGMAECTCLWMGSFVASHPVSDVMAARVVVLWDKSVFSCTVFVVDSSPLTSSKLVMAVVSMAWVLGVGGAAVLFVE